MPNFGNKNQNPLGMVQVFIPSAQGLISTYLTIESAWVAIQLRPTPQGPSSIMLQPNHMYPS